MSKFLTEEQMKELVVFAIQHPEPIVGFGADMYRQGYNRGFRDTVMGITIGVVSVKLLDKIVIPKVKEHLNNKTQ